MTTPTATVSATAGITLSDVLRRHARVRPDRVAFVDPRRRCTFSEMDDRVTRLANALSARGVGRGDRVAVLGYNSIELVESWLAALRLGAVAVPVNFRMVADEIAYVLADSGAVAVVTDIALAPAVEQARAKAPSVDSVLTIGGDLDEIIAASDNVTFDVAVDVADEAPAFIMYTSGTTGFPKGAVLTHRNLYLHAFSSIATLGHRDDDDCWMAVAPLFHTAGVSGMLPMFLNGGTAVIPPSGGFDAAAIVDTIVDEQVTSCWMTPAQWQIVCALPDLGSRDLSRLRRVWWGAAPASTTLLRSMIDAFPHAEIIAAFGQTECSPITCLLRGEDAIRKIGSVGTPMLNVETRIVDDEMNDVAQGEVGEIVYLGPLVMKEYWEKEAETAEAFRGGWFHSGDLVRQDEDGYIYVVDRKKDMIISGGENIYCAEVENALATCAKVAEVAIIGVPDPNGVKPRWPWSSRAIPPIPRPTKRSKRIAVSTSPATSTRVVSPSSMPYRATPAGRCSRPTCGRSTAAPSPMQPAPPTLPCWTRRSAPTSNAPPRPTPMRRRSSTSRAAGAGPTPS